MYTATGKDPMRERLLENEKNNFKLVAEKVYYLSFFLHTDFSAYTTTPYYYEL